VVEARAEVVRVGRRSRELALSAHVICRGRPDLSASAAQVLDEPLPITTARGIVVVPLQ
jgi:3-aminobutyryl-CoA ammonia-lyase